MRTRLTALTCLPRIRHSTLSRSFALRRVPAVWPHIRLATSSAQPGVRESVSYNSSSGEHGRDETCRTLLDEIVSRLPQRFQQKNAIATVLEPDSSTNAQALGDLLLKGHHDGRIDILYELAISRGQWKSVVWIVQRILATAGSIHSSTAALSQLVQRNSSSITLRELTNRPITELGARNAEPEREPTSIDRLLGSKNLMIVDTLNEQSHKVLGCVWQSLGLMTLACARDPSVANGSIKTELLEIIALFHHHGFMPEAVYAYESTDRPDAIQQPPTLYLLSTDIMKALSEAAWRGRETAALETADSMGGDTNSIRLEMLGSAVRANQRGVKPEMWLELILWSCLYGGWLNAGIATLNAVCHEQEPGAWNPISWRQSLKSNLQIDPTRDVDWAKLQAVLSVEDTESASKLQVHKTLSSELLNAYIEALTDWTLSRSIELGIGIRLEKSLRQLEVFRNFLRRTSMNLHVGTWDALLLRLIDYNQVLVRRGFAMEEFVRLAPKMGEELTETEGSHMPAEVFDGSAALLGLLHRALQVQIGIGNATRAMRIVDLIRKCIDNAKQKSLEDFFSSNILLDSDSARVDLRPQQSSKAFSGIEYPNFQAQIPLITMGALLELLVRTGRLEHGKALVFGNDLEPPLLDPEHCGHPDIAPALSRFAAATKDEELLQKIVDARLSASIDAPTKDLRIDAVMGIILWEQFASERLGAKKWGVIQRLTHKMQQADLSPGARAISMIGALLLRQDEPERSDKQLKSWRTFKEIVLGKSRSRNRKHYRDELRDVVRFLSVVDKRFDESSRQLDDSTAMVCPEATEFNVVLEAVAATKGSASAQQLVEAFLTGAGATGSKFWSGTQNIASSPRSAKRTQGRTGPRYSVTTDSGEQRLVQGRLQPNITTYSIVLKQGLIEAQQKRDQLDAQPADSAELHKLSSWAVQGMLAVERHGTSLSTTDLLDELRSLTKHTNTTDFLTVLEDITASTVEVM